jgi:hypothetical protein
MIFCSKNIQKFQKIQMNVAYPIFILFSPQYGIGFNCRGGVGEYNGSIEYSIAMLISDASIVRSFFQQELQ